MVTATDNGGGTLKCTPVYYEVDANDNVSANSTPNPTFTNTYSTSLPLSGMSGVTLTYLAGAAVLCAAAAWMHVRRKANAKEASVVNKESLLLPDLVCAACPP